MLVASNLTNRGRSQWLHDAGGAPTRALKARCIAGLQALLTSWVGVAAFIASVQAHDYPTRPIRLIIPYAAGGNTDRAGRLFAELLTRDLKQPVIIDNRAGRIGAQVVTMMAPDGYNLLLTTNGTQTNVAVTEKSMPYDPVKDLTPISEIASYGFLMVAHPSVPATSVQEFIAYAKRNPGSMTYASSGPGSGLHFAAEVFKSMAGVDMVHVPYQSDWVRRLPC